MAINLCNPLMKTQVHSDKVCRDRCEPSNLVSSIPANGSRGFMVDTFIKPPVNLTFHFSFCVEIEKIIINGRQGSQGATRLEIYSHISSPEKISENSNLYHDSLLSNTRTLSSGNSVSQRIGSNASQDQTIFKFTNKNFRPNGKLFDSQVMTPRYFSEGDLCSSNLYFHNFAYLQRVDSVTVRIVSSVPGAVAAVKWVEIWGCPARGTVAKVMGKIRELIVTSNKSNQGDCRKIKDKEVASKPKCDKPGEEESLTDSSYVPNEFLDPLTQEIMALPMLLPCGQTIDSSTLERHAKAEASWGRSPSDPFTGSLYTTTVKPIPNSALKARIDEYLLKHGSRLDHHKVGRFECNRPCTSVLVNTDPHSDCATSLHCDHERSSTGKLIDKLHSPESRSPGIRQQSMCIRQPHHIPFNTSTSECSYHSEPNSNLVPPKKRVKTSTTNTLPTFVDLTAGENRSSAIIDLTEDEVSYPQLRKKSRGPARSSGYTSSSSVPCASHKDRLTQSLDAALTNTLSSLPSYRTYSRHVPTESTSASQSCNSASVASEIRSNLPSCDFCEQDFEGANSYRLPCSHAVCRSCALSVPATQQAVCKVCSQRISHQAIVKIHSA